MTRRGALLLGILAIVVLAGGALLVTRGEPPAAADLTDADTPIGWTGPVRERGNAAAPEGAQQLLSLSEPPDTAPAWADIAQVGVQPESENWRLELGADHPTRAALVQAGQVLAFGFVMDTTGDGAADYVVGIDSDAPGGAIHVWLTNLATGETEERSGGPYGDPFDFFTSLESGPEDMAGGPDRGPGADFFNVGFAPPELFDSQITRFYAWSSLTENGEVVAWDYAPDAGWLGGAPREQLGCAPLACPMTGPPAGPGAREWIVRVENQTARDAHLFVARDEMPMGELVGTAVPASVPAGVTQEVRLTVPAGSGWAVFVNPTPQHGPLILAQDVPAAASGVLPISIIVQASGAVVSAPGAPGWFGN